MANLAIRGGKIFRTKPFSSWPIHGEKELSEVTEVLESGNWSYHARKCDKQTSFAEKFARFHDAKYGICTSNGMSALEVSLKATGVGVGDEVIVPALTFVATASVAIFLGATPVFVDIDADTYCIDINKIKQAVTDKTRAIIPVHLYCSVADMDEIMKIASKNNLVVIEDCAHAHGSKWRGKGVGSFGATGCFSFQQSKTMTAGEGGIITTNDNVLEETCTSLTDCGRVRKNDKNAQNMLGWNYRMTEFQAAILLGQLERLPEQVRKREENGRYLSERLVKIEGIRPLKRDERITRQSYYYYILKYDKEKFEGIHRDRFLRALYYEGIPCERIYEPVYKDPLYKPEWQKLPVSQNSNMMHPNYSSVNCPVTEKASYEEAIAISHNVLLGEREDIDDVVGAIEKIRDNLHELQKSDSYFRKALRVTRRYVA
jgi:L-glutamine:2-deoxy-scyllo-inosose/3-amino-2,3-dideoxy-scyllo-inosose aminotransferase